VQRRVEEERGESERQRVMQEVVELQVSALQCVAVCCSVLQCVAVCCSVLQCVACMSLLHTPRSVFVSKGWQRLIGCLKLQVIFRKRATNYRALLRKMTYEDKPSYASSPPCMCVCLSLCVSAGERGGGTLFLMGTVALYRVCSTGLRQM